MTLRDLGDLPELFYHLFIQTGLLQINANVSTGPVPQFPGIHLVTGTLYDPPAFQALHPLMDRCPRHPAPPGYLQKRRTGFLHQDLQNLFVQIVNS